VFLLVADAEELQVEPCFASQISMELAEEAGPQLLLLYQPELLK